MRKCRIEMGLLRGEPDELVWSPECAEAGHPGCAWSKEEAMNNAKGRGTYIPPTALPYVEKLEQKGNELELALRDATADLGDLLTRFSFMPNVPEGVIDRTEHIKREMDYALHAYTVTGP